MALFHSIFTEQLRHIDTAVLWHQKQQCNPTNTYVKQTHYMDSGRRLVCASDHALSTVSGNCTMACYVSHHGMWSVKSRHDICHIMACYVSHHGMLSVTPWYVIWHTMACYLSHSVALTDAKLSHKKTKIQSHYLLFWTIFILGSTNWHVCFIHIYLKI